MERRWILAAAVVAVLAGGFLLARLARRAARGGGRAVAEAPLDPLVAAGAEDTGLSAPGVGPARTARGAVAGESDAPAQKQARAEPAEETRLVELVESGTLRPVANAEVGYRSFEGSWNPLAFERLMGLPDTRRVVADERGMARLAWPARETLLVLAREGERTGAAPVPPPRAPSDVARVELHPDWGVTVEVLTADGRPAARVPVSMTLRKPSWSAIEHRSTGADGLVHYEHVGVQFALQSPSAVAFALALPLSHPEERTLERDAAPREPIRFRLAAGGEVALTLLDRAGAPVPDETRVQLGLLWPGETRNESPFASGRERERFDAQTVGGRVSFEHVELGAELEIDVQLPGASASEGHSLRGPAQPGERVEQVLVIGEGQTLLQLRALEDGAGPLADTELELELEHQGKMSRRDSHTARTDSAGRFSLALSTEFAEGDQRNLFVLARDGRLGAPLDLSRPFPPETVDLGDVVLASAPLVVSGRVVDGAGEGLEGATVQLEYAVDGELHESSDWERSGITARSGGAGEFAVHRFLDVSRVRVWAELPGRRSDAVEAALGAHGVVLRLLATGGLAGDVLLDPGVPETSLQLRLTRASEAGAQEEAGVLEVMPDRRFRREGLLPGRYAVVVGLEDDDAELARVDGVDVRPGETSEDPRLQGLDLRGRLHAVRILLRPPTPGALLSGDMLYHATGAGEALRWQGVDGARVEFATAWERIDATLSVHGFRRVELRGVSGDVEVDLRSGLPVRLVLPASITLPEPPLFVKAVLSAPGDDAGIDWGAPAFDSSRELVGLAPDSGPMRVCWIVERRQGGGASATTLSLETEQLVEVRELEAEQRFELEISDAALQRALDQSGLR